MPRGICKLCLLAKDLKDGHLVPRAAYGPLRAPWDKNPNPVLYSNEVGEFRTGKQISDYVLCAKCEDRFNRGGERWVLNNMARPSGFPLREKISAATGITVSPTMVEYDASKVAGVSIDKLAYFGLSVFWKAAVHSWRIPDLATLVRIELGPYKEGIRKFLMGEGPWPRRTYLVLAVASDAAPVLGMFPPTPQIEGGARSYVFCIPGMEFRLAVGRQVPPESEERCLCTSATHPIHFVTTLSLRLADAMNKNRAIQKKNLSW